MAVPQRAVCRVSLAALPLRRLIRTKPPKLHPATGIPLSKAKGQHLLHNQGVLMKIVEAADLKSSDSVFEVGCGTGELTMQLLPYVRQVHTIDIEQRMVHETQQRAQAAGHSNLDAAVGDALRMPWPRRFDVCVSNLPYQITTPFIFKLMRRLSEGPPWRAAVLMVQREVADRLVADPGEQTYSRLAINVRLFARAFRMFDVRPGSFMPAPQVHSTVLRLEPRLPPPQVDFDEWDAMTRVIFSRRRKTLRAQFKKISTTSMLEQNYKVWCSLQGKAPDPRPFPQLLLNILEEEGVLYDRAFAMDIDDLHNLLRAFNRQGVRFNNVQDMMGAEEYKRSIAGAGGSSLVDDDDGIGPYFAGPHVSRGSLRTSGDIVPPPPLRLRPRTSEAAADGVDSTLAGGEPSFTYP